MISRAEVMPVLVKNCSTRVESVQAPVHMHNGCQTLNVRPGSAPYKALAGCIVDQTVAKASYAGAYCLPACLPTCLPVCLPTCLYNLCSCAACCVLQAPLNHLLVIVW